MALTKRRPPLADLVRNEGSGTYVTRRPVLQNSLDSNFSYTEYLARAGIRAGKKVLSARSVVANEETAAALGLDEGSRVVEVRRLRTADGHPAVYSVDSLPTDLAVIPTDKPAFGGSLYKLLAEKGHYVDHGEAIVAPAL